MPRHAYSSEPALDDSASFSGAELLEANPLPDAVTDRCVVARDALERLALALDGEGLKGTARAVRDAIFTLFDGTSSDLEGADEEWLELLDRQRGDDRDE
jgi:hypothetical protein